MYSLYLRLSQLYHWYHPFLIIVGYPGGKHTKKCGKPKVSLGNWSTFLAFPYLMLGESMVNPQFSPLKIVPWPKMFQVARPRTSSSASGRRHFLKKKRWERIIQTVDFWGEPWPILETIAKNSVFLWLISMCFPFQEATSRNIEYYINYPSIPIQRLPKLLFHFWPQYFRATKHQPSVFSGERAQPSVPGTQCTPEKIYSW